MIKRGLSLILALCMLFSAFPLTALAQEGEQMPSSETTAPTEPEATEPETTEPATSAPAEPEETEPVTTAPAEEEKRPKSSRVSSQETGEPEILQSGTCGDHLSWTFTSDGKLTISGTGDMVECYDAPWEAYRDQITQLDLQYGITSLGPSCFRECVNLTSVVIPSSVKKVGTSSFGGCISLTDVVIPDSVTELEGSSFYGCTSLTTVTIPDSVTSFSNSLFLNCTNLTSITISDKVTALEERCFYGCKSLKEIRIPDSVTSLGAYCFRGCGSLTDIRIPDSVTSIGAGCFESCINLSSAVLSKNITALSYETFENCQSLTDIIIPASVTSLGANCFSGCKNLTGITLPDSLRELGGSCFNNCASLTEIFIPDSVTRLGDYCFNNCASLTEIFIPDSVTRLGDYCFSNCVNLTSVRLPNALRALPDGLFLTCSSLTGVTIPASVSKLGDSCFMDCENLKNLTIPDGVSSLGSSCFLGCTSLTEMTIPATVTELGSRCFYDCTGLTSITIPDSVTQLGIWCFSGCVNLASVTVLSSLTALPSCCFYGCTSLSRISLPDSLTSLGDSCFQNCTSLSRITIPSGVTALSGSCFAGCTQLRSMVIPDTITSLGQDCFNGCTALTDITIPDSVITMGDRCFYKCTSLSGVRLSEQFTSLGRATFAYCESLSAITIPDNIAAIGVECFFYCKKLEKVTLPRKLTTLGERSFSHCESLRNVEIPGLVTALPDFCFYSCAAMNRVVLPEGLASMGKYCFSGCVQLTDVWIPDSVTTMGDGCFNNCKVLNTVKLPRRLTSIPYSCFGTCENLLKAEIPGLVTSIGNFAFGNCKRLESISFLGDPPTIGYDAFSSVTANVYYPAKSTRWNTENMQNYYGKLTWLSSENLFMTVDDDHYVIRVWDTEGNPIAGAEVTYDGNWKTTDSSGCATFLRVSSGQPHITITCPGYLAYDSTGKNYAKTENGFDIFVMVRAGSPECFLRLQSAKYQDTILGINGFSWDVLYGTKVLSNSNPSEKFDLYVSAFSEDVKEYRLLEGGREIARCGPDGHFAGLQISSFTPDKRLTVRVFGSDGAVLDTGLNLFVAKDVSVETTSYSLGDEIAFSVSSDVPYVGGSQMKLDIPVLPVQIAFGADNSVRMAINMDLKDPNGKKTDDEQWKLLTQVVQRVKETEQKPMSADLIADIDELIKDKQKMFFPAAGDTDLVIVGFAEGALNSDGTGSAKGSLAVKFSVSHTVYGPMRLVGWVPVTYKFKMAVEVGTPGTFQYNFGTEVFTGDMSLEITPELEVFGGVGVSALVAVGAYGDAKLPVAIEVFGSNPGPKTIKLTGELGATLYAGPFEYKVPLGSGTWHLYTRTKGKMVVPNTAPYATDLYSQDQFRLPDLSYLADTSGWMGTSRTRAVGLGMSVLQSNIYRNSRPVLGNANGTPVLVWAAGNDQRNAMNASQLMYSVYRLNAWTRPAPVDAANVTAETAPVVATGPDGTLYLAYQRSRTALEDTATMADYAAAQEIVVARFQGSSNKFQDITVLSPETGYHRSPVIAADQNGAAVLWVSNSNTDDLFGVNSTNSLSMAHKTADGWGSPLTLAEQLNAITYTALGDAGGQLTAAVITDGDNNLSTDADHTLTAYPGLGSGVSIASGNISQPAFGQIPGETTSSLIWAGDKGLSRWNGTDSGLVMEGAEFSSGYRVLNDRILFAAPGAQGGAELYARIRNGSSWSEPVAMTRQGKDLQCYDARTIGNATYLIGVQVDATVTAETVEDVCSLAWCKLTGIKDLELYAVYTDNARASSGESYTISADVVNRGDGAVSSFTVTVKDGTRTLASQAVSQSLAPGEKTVVRVDMPALTQEDACRELTVSAVLTGDVNGENNSQTITTGLSDLDISATLVSVSGYQNKALVTVKNNSSIPASGTLYAAFEEHQIAKLTVPQVKAGASSVFEVELTEASLQGLEEGVVEFRVESDVQEYDAMNNTAFLYVKMSHIHKHSPEITAPTCTEKGYTTYTCTCGDSYVDDYTAVVPHGWDNGSVTKDPTDQEEGNRLYTCTVCGETKNEPIPKLEHDHSYETLVTAPTCTERGYTTYTCACGETRQDEYVDALGHEEVQHAAKEPSYTEAGWKAYVTCSRCDYSTYQEIPRLIPAPKKLSVKATSDAASGKVKLTWKAVENAEEYRIYRASRKTGKYKCIDTVQEAGFVDSSGKAGTTYYYYVVAEGSGGESDKSNIVYRCCDLPRPVVELSNSTSTGKIKLNWQDIDRAEGYKIYRATSKSGKYSLLKTTEKSSYTDSDTSAGKKYYYKVKAIASRSAANSAYSEIESRTCDLKRTTVTLGSVSSTGKIKVSWKKVTGAEEYAVYRSLSVDGEYEKIKVTSSSSYTDKSAQAGTTYYYKVVAVHKNSAANSAYSKSQYRTCDLPRPVVKLTSDADSGKIRIRWEAVEGAQEYKIYRSTSKSGKYTCIETTEETELIDKDTATGKKYYYKVKAIHEKSAANSAYSEVESRTCDLPRPEATIALSKGNPRLSWEKVAGAEGYTVYRATSVSGEYRKVKTTTSTNCTDKDVKAGKTYYYKVKAIHDNSAANSAYSTVQSIMTE